MIFTGSREWGEPRPDQRSFPPEWIQHELAVSAQSVGRLVGRWVIGNIDKKRDRSAVSGPGLVVRQGGAPGLDSAIIRVTTYMGTALRRRTRAEYSGVVQSWGNRDLLYSGTALANGLTLETYLADWDNVPRHRAGPERNQRMLDAEPRVDHVVALFAHGRAYGPGIGGGTNDMVRRAVKAGVPVDIYVANDRRWRKP